MTFQTVSSSDIARPVEDPYLGRDIQRAYDLRESSSPTRIPEGYNESIKGLGKALAKWEKRGQQEPVIGYGVGENQFLTDLPLLMQEFYKVKSFLPNIVEVGYLEYHLIVQMSRLARLAANQRNTLERDFRTGTGFIYGNGGKITVSRDAWDVDAGSTCHMHFDQPLVESPSALHHRFGSVNVPCVTDSYFYTKINYHAALLESHIAPPEVVVADGIVKIVCFKRGSTIISANIKIGEYTEPIKSDLSKFLNLSVSQKSDAPTYNHKQAKKVCQALSVVQRKYTELATQHIQEGQVVYPLPPAPSSMEATAFYNHPNMKQLKQILRSDGRYLGVFGGINHGRYH